MAVCNKQSIQVTFFWTVSYLLVLLQDYVSTMFNKTEAVSCPRSQNEYLMAASQHCPKIGEEYNYICVPNENKTELVQFCFKDGKFPAWQLANHCPYLHSTGNMNSENCSSFSYGCPRKHYMTREIYMYPACFEIHPERKCYVAEVNCNTLSGNFKVNPSNANTATIVLPIVLGVFGLFLGITVSLICWRRRGNSRKESSPDDEKLSFLSTPENDTCISKPIKASISGIETASYPLQEKDTSNDNSPDDEEPSLLSTPKNDTCISEQLKGSISGIETASYPLQVKDTRNDNSPDDEEPSLLSTPENDTCISEQLKGSISGIETASYPLQVKDTRNDDSNVHVESLVHNQYKIERKEDGNLRQLEDNATLKKVPKVSSNKAEEIKSFFSEQSSAEIKDNIEKVEVGVDMFLIACHYGILNICQNVIKYFPEMLNQVDIEGCNAAIHAACGKNIELFELLIRNGVDPKHKSNCGSNILHSACMESDLEMCTHIIKHYPDMLNQVDNKGWNSALYTAKEGSVEVLGLLVKNGVDIALKDIHGSNILHLACCGSKYKICQFIIKHYPDMISQLDNGGENAAFYAAKGGNIEILKVLKMNGVDVKLQSNDGMNILHMACMNARLEISKHIIEHYPDMLNKLDNEGRNVALYAAKGGNLEILKILVRNGVDPTLQSHDGINILHMACMNAQLEMCRNIIKHYPDMLTQVSSEGWNAIICAAHGGSVEILELLVRIGLDPMHKNNNGCNILHISCMASNVEMCRHIINHYPEMLNQVDNNGWNAGICTVLGGNVQVLKLLVENGLNLMQSSSGGINILQVACLKSKLEICQYIIEHYPAMLNQVDHGGKNAAIYAAMAGDVEVLQLLADHGLRPRSS